MVPGQWNASTEAGVEQQRHFESKQSQDNGHQLTRILETGNTAIATVRGADGAVEFILLEILVAFPITVTVAVFLMVSVVAKLNVIAAAVMAGSLALLLNGRGAQLGLQNGTSIRVPGVQLTETGSDHFVGVC